MEDPCSPRLCRRHPPVPVSQPRRRCRRRAGRRTSIGLAPPPGACSARPAWWSRADWTGVEVWCVVAAGVDVCRAVHADPHTVVRVARAMAGYADYTTGRDCRPTNTRLADDLAMSVRQIQRARDALKRLHLVVELVRGRSVLTRAERLAAWRRGSAHRRLAAEFALLSVRRRPQPAGLAVGHVTPPGVSPGMSPTSPKGQFFTRTDRTKTGAPRRAPTQRSQTCRADRTYPADVRVRRLITGLQQRKRDEQGKSGPAFDQHRDGGALLVTHDVGVGPGRGVGIAPIPSPRPALRTGRATWHRIRRSTNCRCYAG